MASTDFDRKLAVEERHQKGLKYQESRKPRQLGPEVLVKTSRSGRPFKDNDRFGLDFNVEYSLNKQSRWDLPEIIAGELSHYPRATLSSVSVNMALSRKELKKIEESKSFDKRYHLKGASALEFHESRDDEMTHKRAKSGRAQLRTWTDPKKHSLPHDYEEEERVICICGKCKQPKENVVDYTVIKYTSTCRDGDRRFWKTRMQQQCGEEKENEEEEISKKQSPFVSYLPKKKKNEVRRQKHSKRLFAE